MTIKVNNMTMETRVYIKPSKRVPWISMHANINTMIVIKFR